MGLAIYVYVIQFARSIVDVVRSFEYADRLKTFDPLLLARRVLYYIYVACITLNLCSDMHISLVL